MRFERKHAVLLLSVAVWNVFIWLTFAKNLSAAHAAGEHRPTGYWVAHTVLIVVNLLIAGVLARVGVRGWKATRPTERVEA
ncbi:MAG: SCO4848 family membrane protein [Nocardioidaceae bacterium]